MNISALKKTKLCCILNTWKKETSFCLCQWQIQGLFLAMPPTHPSVLSLQTSKAMHRLTKSELLYTRNWYCPNYRTGQDDQLVQHLTERQNQAQCRFECPVQQGFFSQSRLSVQTPLWRLYSTPSVRTLKIPIAGNHTIVWTLYTLYTQKHCTHWQEWVPLPLQLCLT